jgi:hypothetical protein
MSKRIVASAMGVLALAAGLIAVVYALEGMEYFTKPAAPLRLVVLGELLLCSMALAAFGIGIRFLQFARYGRIDQSRGWTRRLLLGIGIFLSGFLFSLPLTILWANHTWPGDGQSVFAALEGSVYTGVAAAGVYWLLRWKKSRSRHFSRMV